MPGHLDDKLVDSGRYDALRNTHNHDQDDNHSESSSTEVDEEWGDNEEEAGSDSRLNCPSKKSREWRRRRGSVWAKIQKYRWVVDTALLLVIVGLLLEKRWSHRRAHRYEFAGDVTGFAPKFSQQIKTFKPDPIFVPENASEFWSSETQQAWLDIVPSTSIHSPTPSRMNTSRCRKR
ncbi:hypothetical protein BU24DRAFT_419321 [Aaosphaeria arxii CBS 175.79]|uniref:Uncharacterized protein n=1 Tax=Aaosphaeria arxii CBS 175.79 TaxID=1450172 RepID=A0A6A5Y370_9PLEO|nr:uncharacterized protein BU24DRAFT_419321 [Aaosphaeria arxii CBS 175.79]KAF2019696.1 hypothetical protein BU24DRAFT_419321 [Aaosphaeria arxii CBS 175.79]